MKHNNNMPDYAFTIRELENRDLPEVAQILADGFPRLSNAYWQNCLRIIKSRDRSPGTPQFGYGIEADGLQGVILAFGSLHGPADSPQTIVNLSSWTVRVSHRGPPARRLYRYASSFDNFTFSSRSAVPRTLKALTQLGFRERTVGQILAVGVRKAPRSAVRIVTTRDAERAGLTPQKSEMLRYHASRGCIAFCIELPDRLAPLIFLPRRVKQTFPAAQLIYCEQIEDFRDNSLSIYLSVCPGRT